MGIRDELKKLYDKQDAEIRAKGGTPQDHTDTLSQFSNDPGGLGSIPLLGPLLDPGYGARQAGQAAVGAYQGLNPPPPETLTYGQQAASPGTSLVLVNGLPMVVPAGQEPPGSTPIATGIGATPGGPGDIMPEDVGAPLTGADFGQSAAGGETNAFGGLTSAFGGLGPSAFEGTQSAATGLGYDAGAEAAQRGAGDYFAKLSQTGNDPIAEADFQRRTALAEQGRKAQEDAALQQLEAKGQGNAGGALAARFGGEQDAANSKYQAALDATAMAAGRRDTAAQAGAGIAAGLGGALEKTATDKAAAEDKYNFYKLSGMDDIAAKRASGLDQFETQKAAGTNAFQANQAGLEDAYNIHKGDVAQHVLDTNYGRANQVSDVNTGLRNQVGMNNKITAPQTAYGNELAKTSGIAGAYNSEAGNSLAANAQLTGNLKSVAGGIAGLPNGASGVQAGINGTPAPAYSAPAQTPFQTTFGQNPAAARGWTT